MSSESQSYLTLLVLMAAAVGFAVTPLALAWVWARCFSPAKPGPSKAATYECGLEGIRVLPLRHHFSRV
jgi:NADH-quinone oxidoreductase subunit A